MQLMQSRKEVRIDVVDEQKVFGGYAMSKTGRGIATRGAFSVVPIDRFFWSGKEYRVAYNESGIDLFDQEALFDKDRKLRVEFNNTDTAMISFSGGEPQLYSTNNPRHMKALEYIMHSSMNASFPYRREEANIYIRLHDVVAERASGREKARMVNEARGLVYNLEMSISEWRDRIANMIKAVNPKGLKVDIMGVYDVEELRDVMLSICNTDPQKSINFLAEQEDRWGNLLKMSVHHQLIHFNKSTRTWEWLRDGKPFSDNDIFVVGDRENANQAMLDYLKTNTEHARALTDLIKSVSK